MFKRFVVLTLGVVGLGLPSAARAGLVAHWKMDESGGEIADASGNDIIGTPSSAGLAYAQSSVPAGAYGSITVLPGDAAAFGTSIAFTRSSATAGGRFSLGAPGAIDALAEGGAPGTGAFTVMAWVQSVGLPASTSYRVFSTGRPGGWGLGLANVDRLRFTTYGVSDFTSATTAPFNGNWHHIAASWSNGALTAYIDGNPVGMTTGGNTTTFIEEAGTDYSIGSTDPAADFFNGRIDDLKIFDTAMSRAEIIAAAVPVPEPAAGAALAGAATIALGRRRRTR